MRKVKPLYGDEEKDCTHDNNECDLAREAKFELQQQSEMLALKNETVRNLQN